MVGAPVPAELEGISLAPVITGQRDTVRDTILLGYKDVQRAVRHGEWKLVRYPEVNKTQLFNLNDDPHETRNLAQDPLYAGKIDQLLALLRDQQKLFGDTAPLTVENSKPAEVTLEFFL